jgi:predicted lactoylglutathione lyase
MFVNLPVLDLDRSVEFFKNLGLSFNSQFTNEKAACMIIGDEGFVMLIARPYFGTFTNKQFWNPQKETEMILGISATNKEEVKNMVKKALQHGGKSSMEPQDHGFMYQESFEDLDGHLWEILYLDMEAIPSSS